MKNIFSNNLANRLYNNIREDNYTDFVKNYMYLNIKYFHEKLIFQAVLDDGREASHCKNLQPYVNFLMNKKPSVQLLALLIAQGEEVNISKNLEFYSEGDKSVIFKSAIENKNIYVIKQLFNHIDDNVLVSRLFYVGLENILQDVALTDKQCISVLTDFCKKCKTKITINSLDLTFYKTVLNKHFNNEVASLYLKNYVDNAKSMLGPDKFVVTFESPIEYVYKESPKIPCRLYYPTNLKAEYDSQSLNCLSEAQKIYLSISLEKLLESKQEHVKKMKL